MFSLGRSISISRVYSLCSRSALSIMSLMNSDESEQRLRANVEEWQRQHREKNAALKRIFDPAKDFTPEQIDLLLRWGDTLHFYRQLPGDTQDQARLHMITYEKDVFRQLGEVNLRIVRRVRAGDPNPLYSASKLCDGTIAATREYFDFDEAGGETNGRFGYEFLLTRGGQDYELIVFFRNGNQLSETTKVVIENSHFNPTSVVDLPQNRTFQPFRIFPTH